MTRARGFPPIAGPDATVLILGSMPGERSLAAQQYYAHPRNVFWRIMGELLGFDAAAGYAQRISALKRARIALWDVLDSCVRPGSLDADIESGTLEVNDFDRFFRTHPEIEHVFFNGAAAETHYRRHVLPLLDAAPRRHARLPSTSPANAGLSYQEKFEVWRSVVTATN